MNTKIIENKEHIFDPIRKKYVRLTKEEWVRQQFIQSLLLNYSVPREALAIEKQLIVGNTKRRFDILVFKQAIPWMVVECKQEEEPINDHTLQQILAYNTSLKVAYLVITNGRFTQCYSTETNAWLAGLPTY